MKTQVTNQHDFTLGGLKSVEEFDRSKTYLKVIDENKIHNNMIYELGINEDILPFNDNPEDSCVKGGLYFTTLEYLPKFCDYGTIVAEIKILDNSKLIKDSDTKYRTDKFEIIKFWDMNEFLEHVGYIHIDGDAYFLNLETAKGLETLKSINGDGDFYNLKSVKGLKNLEIIEGYADFNNLESAKGLENLEKIGSDAFFDSLKHCKNLKSLGFIGGNAFFDSLHSIKEIVCKDNICGEIYCSDDIN
jgi:hypothetical protein